MKSIGQSNANGRRVGGGTTEFFMNAVRISLTPRFSGVIVRCWPQLNLFSGFSLLGTTNAIEKSLKRFSLHASA